MIGGRPIGASRVRRGLVTVIELARLTDPSGGPLHVTPEMTLRYAHLASDTVRNAYVAAMVKARARQPILVADQRGTVVANKVEWLHEEMLKTRLAGGLYARRPAAGACSYANICEQCDNFTSVPEFSATLEAQLADVVLLRDDTVTHDWYSEVDRNNSVIENLERHIERLQRNTLLGPSA
jgi:hypothetical protein